MSSLSQLFSSLPAVVAERPSVADAFNFLGQNLVKQDIGAYGGLNEGYEEGLTPIKCEDLGELISRLRKKIQMASSAEDALVICLATAVSLEVAGPFLWVHITGPSSSLKTTILELVGAAHDRVFSVTEFTSFYSGSTVGGKDNSLLPQLQGKLFIIKDLTPILNTDLADRNKIFGQWRAIYDGSGEKFFNNGVHLDFKGVRFACLTGVTYTIYQFGRSDLGERFLIADINADWDSNGRLCKHEAELGAEGNAFDSIFSTIEAGFGASDTLPPRLDQLDDERRMTWGYLNHLMEYMYDESDGLKKLAGVFKADPTIKTEIDALAVWLEHARCPMAAKEAQVRPSPAEPHRTIKQISKMAMCIAIVFKADSVTQEIRRLVRKVAFDTGRSFSLEIMNFVACHPMSEKQILAGNLSITDTYVSKICDHLISIGVLEKKIKQTGRQGQPPVCYDLTMKFRILADIIQLKESHTSLHVQPSMLSVKDLPSNVQEPPSTLDALFASLQRRA